MLDARHCVSTCLLTAVLLRIIDGVGKLCFLTMTYGTALLIQRALLSGPISFSLTLIAAAQRESVQISRCDHLF